MPTDTPFPGMPNPEAVRSRSERPPVTWPDGAPEPPSGEGLDLRLPNSADIEDIVEICRDPEVQAWTTIPENYTPEDAEAWIRHAAQGWNTCHEFGFVGVDESTRLIVGTVGVRSTRPDRRIADIGYTVSPRARGRGIAPRMVHLVRTWTLGVWPVERFQIHVYVGNTPSERVAEKCGFRREGVLRRFGDQRGRLRDAVMFSWLPDETSRNLTRPDEA